MQFCFFTQTNWTGLWLKLNVKFDDVTVFPTGLMPALRNPTWWTSAILSWWDQVNYLAFQFVVAGGIQIPAALSVDNAVRCDVTCCSAKWLALQHTCPAALLSMHYLDEHAVCWCLIWWISDVMWIFWHCLMAVVQWAFAGRLLDFGFILLHTLIQLSKE